MHKDNLDSQDILEISISENEFEVFEAEEEVIEIEETKGENRSKKFISNIRYPSNNPKGNIIHHKFKCKIEGNISQVVTIITSFFLAFLGGNTKCFYYGLFLVSIWDILIHLLENPP